MYMASWLVARPTKGENYCIEGEAFGLLYVKVPSSKLSWREFEGENLSVWQSG